MALAVPTSAPIYFRALATKPWERSDRAAATAWQRARLFHAITRAVAAKGYAKVTVADIVAFAGMSRRTFYEHFRDVEDCFVAAYEAGTGSLLAEIEASVGAVPAEDWHDRFEVAISAYLHGLASDPDMARACLVDVLGAGPRAVEARRRVYSQFVDRMRVLRHGRPDGRGEIPNEQFRAAVGAIGELVHERILDQGAATLPELTSNVVEIGQMLLESPVESLSTAGGTAA